MSVFYDLKVNRDLLNYKFDGYKLNLDPLPVYRLSLENEVNSPKLPDDFFSYQHLKAFGIINKLYLDPWNEDSLYFIDAFFGIHCAHLEPKMNFNLLKEKKVAQIDNISSIQKKVSSTLSFPSEDYAVISNGASGLCIYNTGIRRQDKENWKICFVGEPVEADSMFIIQHTSTSSSADNFYIEVILTEVSKNGDTKPHSSHYLTKLQWITFQKKSELSFEIKRKRTIETTGVIDYGLIDDGNIFIASDKNVSFKHDSINPITEVDTNQQEEGVEELQQVDSIENEEEASYNWSQKGRDITVFMRMKDHISGDDVVCDITTNNLKLMVKEEVLLDGELYASVVKDSCTWTLSDGKLLEIYLEGVETDKEWKEVVKGNKRGRMVLPEEKIEVLNELLKPFEPDDKACNSTNVPFNLQQLEECDQLATEGAALYCFDGDKHHLKHKLNISNHQWLFSYPTPNSTIPLICLRHDVDGLIFQLNSSQDAAQGDWKNGEEDAEKSNESECTWQHIATLHAFGYLQASKQQKKFTVCSTDFSFVVIAEDKRHIFIYKQPEKIQTSLRNRKTSERVETVAKQHLVSLECSQTVEGIIATRHRLFILTSQSLYCVQVNTD